MEEELPASLTQLFLVLDNVKMHKGKQVQGWLAIHPRFKCHFLPVHFSWMNQVEQWFGLLQRKRLRISDFSDLSQLAEQMMAFVAQWNAHAHPFHRPTKSVAKVMAKCEVQAVCTASTLSVHVGKPTNQGELR